MRSCIAWLLAAASLGHVAAAAQESVDLRSSEGAVVTYSVPLVTGGTGPVSFRLPGVDLDSLRRVDRRARLRVPQVAADSPEERLLRLGGTLVNRGREPVRIVVFALPAMTEDASPGEGERALVPGSPGVPVLFARIVRPGERLDLAAVPIRDPEALLRLARIDSLHRITRPVIEQGRRDDRVGTGGAARVDSVHGVRPAVRLGILVAGTTARDGAVPDRIEVHVQLERFTLPSSLAAVQGRRSFSAATRLPMEAWLRQTLGSHSLRL
jgi:hypothetical protein